MVGRLLDCTLGDPYSNVAFEEALFRSLEDPVLRLWDNQKSVVVGRAQLPAAETNLDLCRARSIPVVRRFSAGGTVYNGPGNLNWSFVERRPEGAVFDASGVFERFGRMVVSALRSCSVEAAFERPNRITTKEGKVSGMAAYVSSVGVLCHGTLLTGADLEEVSELTRPSPEALPPRYPRNREMRVANCVVARDDFREALVGATEIEYSPDVPKAGERENLASLLQEKYSKTEWNLGDPFA